MTIISTHKRLNNREQFNKAVHAKARKEVIRHPEALRSFEHFQYAKCRCSYCIPDVPRRGFFLRPWELARETEEPAEEEAKHLWIDDICGTFEAAERRSHLPMTVSLIDIARPAKSKRNAKVIPATISDALSKPAPCNPTPPAPVALVAGDDEFEIWDDDVYEQAVWEDEEDSWEHIVR